MTPDSSENTNSDQKPRPRYERFDRIIATGTFDELKSIRAEIHALKESLERQLANDKNDCKIRITDLVGQGVDFNEATLRVDAEKSAWRSRSANLLRRCHDWQYKIKGKIQEHIKKQPSSVYAAVVVPGAGRTAEKAAETCNMFIKRGSAILAVTVVGADLVVIAREPDGDRQ